MSGAGNTPSHAVGLDQQQTGLGLPPWISRGSVLMVFLAVLAPAALPIFVVGLPVMALVTIWRLKAQSEAKAGPAERQAPKVIEIERETREGKPLSVKKEDSVATTPTPVDIVGMDEDAGGKPAAKVPVAAGAGSAGGHSGQRAAVGGAAILAKLRAAKQRKPASGNSVVVAYASQTGTAAEVAKNIGSSIESEGVKTRVLSMNQLGLVGDLNKEKTPFVVWVASSTGDGEAPDNATKFYNDLRNRNRNEIGALQGVQFTGLGLGDSNYTRFMAVPRVVKNRFLELGATEFHPCVEADEVDGIEEIIDAWVEKLVPAVKAVVQPEADADAKPAREPAKELALPVCSVEVLWIDAKDASGYMEPEGEGGGREITASSPFLAPISDARYLTTEASDADRRVVHVQFDLAGSGIQYGPGDSLAVLPENDPALVDGLLTHMDLDGSKWFALAPRDRGDADAPSTQRPSQHIKWPCTVRDAFMHGVELTGPPKKSLLRVLAEHCGDEAEKARLMRLCSREGRQEYLESVLKARRSVVDVIFENPSCKPPLDALLDALPPLAPRMYSISSSPQGGPGPEKAEVAFTAVEYQTASGVERKGVATWWLEGKALRGTGGEEPKIPLYLRKGGAFSPPSSLQVPWVMIGPGTGVSPFRGFLQHRRAALATAGDTAAECWLFFGCRDKAKDYLYGEELELFVEDGTLTKLCVAESRTDPGNKVYVQHLMRQHCDRLRELIVDQDAFVFVCGDGHGMAKDVHGALVEIIASGKGFDTKEAEVMLASMTREARYVKDVWS